MGLQESEWRKMLNNSMVSVIVPVYNPGDKLRDCLDSLTGQTLKPIQIILIDDGSTDNSPEIGKEYAERFPDIIRFVSGPNQGSSAARNRGLTLAEGEWISFVDADDKVAPDFLENLYNNAQNHQADLSCCALQRIKDGKAADISAVIPVPGEVVWERAAVLTNLVHPFLRLGDPASITARGYITLSLFRHDLIKRHKLQFRLGLKINQDEAFFFSYLPYVQRAVLSDKVLYFYVSNPGSACLRFLQKRKKRFAEMEELWCMRWQERYKVFKDNNLKQYFPSAEAPLYLTTRYHELQTAVCDKAGNFGDFNQRYRAMCAEVEYKAVKLADLKRADLKYFFRCTQFGVAAVWLFCTIIKLKKSIKNE